VDRKTPVEKIYYHGITMRMANHGGAWNLSLQKCGLRLQCH